MKFLIPIAGLLLVIFIIMKLDLLAYLYDVEIEDKGIRFVWLSCIPVHFIPFENVEAVKVTQGFFTLAAANYKNRIGAAGFLIVLRKGWYARKVLITPKNPQHFLLLCESAGVQVDRPS